jgi:multidrug efflux pump subunit AcrA (membrane-fusion protein)
MTSPRTLRNSAESATLSPLLLVPPPRYALPLARALLVFFLIALIASVLAPWQQSVPGRGRVVAYAPEQRQQAIEAPVSGRVLRWLVQEGTRVEAGELLIELTDNDPDLLTRMAAERAALETRLLNHESRVSTLEDRLLSLRRAFNAQVTSAEAEVAIAKEEQATLQQKLTAAKAEQATNAANFRRQSELASDGLSSRREFELAELALRKSEAEVESAQAALRAGEGKVAARRAALERTKAGNEADISAAEAALRDARNDVASAQAQLVRLDVDISRQNAQSVRSPVAGTILSVAAARQNGAQVARGERLAVIVPETADRAVELYVDGNDAALIQKGAHVRLQFEGWPAVQFAGWPSVAVGTFGGQVAFVDAADDGKGNFRVLVVPDPGEAWPDPRYLRQGVRANGWFLLEKVRLGYEIWRRFNGFPPAIESPPEDKGEEKKGADKK